MRIVVSQNNPGLPPSEGFRIPATPVFSTHLHERRIPNFGDASITVNDDDIPAFEGYLC
jgi:hypothetical protein